MADVNSDTMLAMVKCAACEGGEPGVSRWTRRVQLTLASSDGSTRTPVLCDDCQDKVFGLFPTLKPQEPVVTGT